MMQRIADQYDRPSNNTGGLSNQRDSVADRFRQEFSLTDRQQFYDAQSPKSLVSAHDGDPLVEAMLGSVQLVTESSTSAMIWSDKKLSQLFPSGESARSGFDPTLHPICEGNGTAERYFGKGESKFSYDQIQM